MATNTCRLPLVVAVLFPIILCWTWTTYKEGEFERERARFLDAGRDMDQQMEKLGNEVDRLKAANKDLARQLPDAVELADLRAKSLQLAGLQAENQRLMGELDKAVLALNSMSQAKDPQPSQAGETAQAEDMPLFTSQGAVTLKSGEAAITGGWKLPDGRHGFAFVTPRVQEDGTVLIESRIATATAEGANASGLSGFLTTDARSANYATMPGQDIRGVLRAMQQGGGMDLMASPRVQTASGQQAEISVLNESGQGVTMQFTPRVQSDGMTVDLDMKTVIQMPSK